MPGVGRVDTELRRDDIGAAFVVRTDEPVLQEALRSLAYAATDGEFVVGSAALAARGFPVAPRDVDFVATDHRRPRRVGRGRVSRGGHVAGAERDGPRRAARLERIDWNGHMLFLSPLDLQLAVCERRGLDDRVEAIRAYERSLV